MKNSLSVIWKVLRIILILLGVSAVFGYANASNQLSEAVKTNKDISDKITFMASCRDELDGLYERLNTFYSLTLDAYNSDYYLSDHDAGYTNAEIDTYNQDLAKYNDRCTKPGLDTSLR